MCTVASDRDRKSQVKWRHPLFTMQVASEMASSFVYNALASEMASSFVYNALASEMASSFVYNARAREMASSFVYNARARAAKEQSQKGKNLKVDGTITNVRQAAACEYPYLRGAYGPIAKRR